MEPNRRATIVDIASAVGVSRQTVSRAMNDMPGINAQTRQRVLDVARELGYRPSRFGRGLVKRGQHTVGLIVDNLTNPYYPELAAAVVAHAAQLGWSVVLLDTSGIDDSPAFLAALAPQIDVLIGYIKVEPDELERALPGVPVVGIDVDPTRARSGWGGVEFQLEPAVRAAVDRLQALGVRRPLMLDSSDPGQPSERARMIAQVWATHGVEMPVLDVEGQDAAAAEAATAAHFARVERADAIMAFNDYVALGAMKTLRRRGIRVPDDVRVIGIDGLAAGTYTVPELSTLGVDMHAAADAAVSIARRLLEPEQSPGPRWARVGYRLMLRESA